MEAKSSVQASQSVSFDDLVDCLNGTKARFMAQGRISRSIWGSHSSIRHQNRGLNHVLGEFKRACTNVSIVGFLFSNLGLNIQASGEDTRPAIMPAAVKVIMPDTVGLLPAF